MPVLYFFDDNKCDRTDAINGIIPRKYAQTKERKCQKRVQTSDNWRAQRKKGALLRFGSSFGLVAAPVAISFFVPRASWLARTDLGQLFGMCIFTVP